MGLLTKNVLVRINGRNQSHFQKCGYDLPFIMSKNGNKVFIGNAVEVNVDDLLPSSTCIVDIECDNCQTVYKKKYYQYTQSNHNGKYYCKKCSSIVQLSGSKSKCWKEYLSEEDRIERRNVPGYNDFIKRVMTRDNYTCQKCNKISRGDLEVHHINGYNWFVDGRTDETNAITLCRNCHASFHMIYGKGDNTKDQFKEWSNLTLNNLLKYTGDVPVSRKIYCIETEVIYNGVSDVCSDFGVRQSIVYNVCNKLLKYDKNGNKKISNKSIKGKHFLWYDEYIKMTQEQIDYYLNECNNNNFRKIRCITTGQIFTSIKEAAAYYNLKNPSSIVSCCKGRGKTAGQTQNGIKLKWEYYF